MGDNKDNLPAAGSTGSAEPEEAATATGLGAKVKGALKRVATSENDALGPPSPDEDEDGQRPKVVKFPSKELRRAFSALGTWALGLSVITKIAIALCLGLAIALPIVIPILNQSQDVRKYYINRTEPLQPVPHPTAFEPLTELERNAEVQVLRSEEGYALVRTSSGRVGYVTKSAINRDRVSMDPDNPFTNCVVRWNEKSPSLCKLRATAQQESCSAYCAEDGNQNECTTACATNLALCMESCNGVHRDPEPEPAPAVPAAPMPTAAAVPTAAAPTAARAAPVPPAARPEGVVQLVPTKTDEEIKKEKRKKRRKKKRRRRGSSSADTATVRMPEME